jgi:hypothetical protein
MDLNTTSFDRDRLERQGALGAPKASEPDASDRRAEMLKGVRSWGTSSIVLGVLHLVGGGFLSAPWGIILILIGLTSFVWRTASMYVIYAMMLAWAGISNLMSGNALWIGFAAFQGLLVFRIVQQYVRFRRAGLVGAPTGTLDLEEDTGRIQATRVFPWLGCVLGMASLAVFVLIVGSVFVWVILSGSAEQLPWEKGFDFILGLAVNVGVLGAAVGTTSLLSRYRWPGLSIAGLVAGGLLVIINLALRLLL